MDVAHHVVNILLIHHNLRKTGGYEFPHKFLTANRIKLHRHNLITRNHALTNLSVLKIYGITEYLHFILHRRIPRRSVDLLLKIIIKLINSETFLPLISSFHSENPHQSPGYPRHEQRHRIKRPVDQIERYRKEAYHEVGVYAEGSLRHKFPGKQHHSGRQQRVSHQHQCLIRQPSLQKRIYYNRESDTVYYQDNIVADKQRGYKHILVAGKAMYYTVDYAPPGSIYLHPYFARLHESDFGSGE